MVITKNNAEETLLGRHRRRRRLRVSFGVHARCATNNAQRAGVRVRVRWRRARSRFKDTAQFRRRVRVPAKTIINVIINEKKRPLTQIS